jgi:hypothetical protein
MILDPLLNLWIFKFNKKPDFFLVSLIIPMMVFKFIPIV